MPSRTPPRRFEATETTSTKLLASTIKQMRATNLRVIRDDEWWRILGVERDADEATIKNARLRVAYEAALKERDK